MKLLDGKLVKKEILKRIKKEVQELDRKPGLCVVQVGEDPASCVYVSQKSKMANELGYKFKHIKLDGDVEQEKLEETIIKLNRDKTIDGILIVSITLIIIGIIILFLFVIEDSKI